LLFPIRFFEFEEEGAQSHCVVERRARIVFDVGRREFAARLCGFVVAGPKSPTETAPLVSAFFLEPFARGFAFSGVEAAVAIFVEFLQHLELLLIWAAEAARPTTAEASETARTRS